MKKAKKSKKYPVLLALKGQIRGVGSSYRKLAKAVGMATNTLSDKINGYYPFTLPEVEAVAIEVLIPPSEVPRFFMPKYYETQQKGL